MNEKGKPNQAWKNALAKATSGQVFKDTRKAVLDMVDKGKDRPATYCGRPDAPKLDLVTLMNHICKGDEPLGRASMYLGIPSLKLFQAFIMGFVAGTREGEIWHEFDKFARNKLRASMYSVHICGVIAHKGFGGGRKGMAKLIELWREYEKTVRNPGASDSERREDQEEKAPQMGS